MIRRASGRRRASRISAGALAIVLFAGSPLEAARVGTGTSDDQQRRVNQIINELDRLGEQIDAIGET